MTAAATASWIVYAGLVATLLAAAAHLLEASCRLVARPARWLWALALALTVALVGLAPGRAAPASSGTPAIVIAPAAAGVGQEGRAGDRGALALVAAVRRLVSAPLAAAAALNGRVPAPVNRGLAAAWLALSAGVLALLAAVHYRLRRARATWPATELHGVRVRLAPHAGPAVVGLVRPEIVVPHWLLARSAEEQQLVLAHEREHVQARDPLLLAAGWALAALIPWHPAVWWMLSRLRLAVELDCDARVLDQGTAPASYGRLLIDLAGQGSGFHVGAPALADTASHLERRLLTMTSHRPRFAPARTGALGGLALLALLAACEAKLPTETDVAQMDVAKIESATSRLNMFAVGDSTAVYTLDGRSITAAEARALKPEQIGQIEVMRKQVNGAASLAQVNIISRKPGDTLVTATGPRVETRIVMREKGDTSPIRSGQGPGDVGRTFDGLLVIDNKIVDPARLRTVPPDEIVSVEVLKGPAAAKLYTDPAAARGVIKITTKAGAAKP